MVEVTLCGGIGAEVEELDPRVYNMTRYQVKSFLVDRKKTGPRFLKE